MDSVNCCFDTLTHEASKSGLLSEKDRTASLCSTCHCYCNLLMCRNNTEEFQRWSRRMQCFNDGLRKMRETIDRNRSRGYSRVEIDDHIVSIMDSVVKKCHDTFQERTKISSKWKCLNGLLAAIKKDLRIEDDDLPP